MYVGQVLAPAQIFQPTAAQINVPEFKMFHIRELYTMQLIWGTLLPELGTRAIEGVRRCVCAMAGVVRCIAWKNIIIEKDGFKKHATLQNNST